MNQIEIKKNPELSNFSNKSITENYTNRYTLQYVLNNYFSVTQKEVQIENLLEKLGIGIRMLQKYLSVDMKSTKHKMKIEHLLIIKNELGLKSVDDLINPRIDLS